MIDMILKFIRSFFTLFFISLFMLGGAIIGNIIFPIISIIYNKDPKKKRIIKLNIVHYTWKFFMFLLKSFHLVSIKIDFNPNELKPSIIIANHPSFLDIVCLISTIKNTSCIVKSSLRKNIFLSNLIKDVYIYNDSSLESLISSSKELLDSGSSLIIFPEGTRTIDKKPVRLHKSFAHLSLNTSYPILPIKIVQSFPLLNKDKPWYKVGTKQTIYTLSIKPYIYPQDFSGSSYDIVCSIKEKVIKTLFTN